MAVIGGGLAGIAAALDAADGGWEVVLLERRRVLGGLTTSVERNGLVLDNGQHVFLRCCTAYRDLLARIGAEAHVRLQRRCDVPVLAPGGKRASIVRDPLPAPLHLARSLATYGHLSATERLRAMRAALAMRRLDRDDPALDGSTFGDWLLAHGQSDRAIDRLWDLICLPTVNLPAREASLALAATVFQIGLLDRHDAGDVGWAAIPLRELHGTFVLEALGAAGVDVRLSTAVRGIESVGGRVDLHTETAVLDVDAAVVATPPSTAASLGVIADDVATALGASPIVNVHLVLDRRVTDLEFFAAIDSPIQFAFDRTVSSGLGTGQCLSISLSAATGYLARSASELGDRFLTALGDLLPAAKDARLLDAVVTREHAATFRGAPGTASLRPGPTTTLPGVYVAGAWCATGWPATMEGAVRSGRDAARTARAASRIDGPLPDLVGAP